MPRKTKKPEDEQSIPEMVEDVTRVEMSLMYKGGKLTAYGRSMEKILDEALPPEKVDEWGFLLSRKEREAIKREAAEKKRIAAEKRVKAAAIRRIRRKAKEGGFGPGDEPAESISRHFPANNTCATCNIGTKEEAKA